ncbi:YihY/virulence factor BrkB family protein [Flavobacterium salilacus subsp. salilacus]|uniref:YihY/virulence factor BrkB family protein n=1 Tax=Flavobacterium TaxID=237 RepID=UPI0010751CB9|nr:MULTISPECIES: YihY/virulence factor BrkB family protein [Flavobacterium]KAF2517519.1 YihY/virulence factor BrkB family protein [Flavobacterium salilacus subsp. salilacus]MBE1615667.1 YihY/virulence factor BrkB family protein [Flavobacterium sp. SaA2.13]
MSVELEHKLERIPVVKHLVRFGKKVKLPWSEGLTLYHMAELYITGIVKGDISYRAGAIAFSFFMSLFPFALFLLNLIPYIPVKNFQQDFMRFVEENVPPNTYDAIADILKDITNTSYNSLLSTGILLAILLMSNGMNAILSGFQSSLHITIKRSYFRQYAVAIGLSLLFTILLIITVTAIITLEVVILVLKSNGFLTDDVYLLEIGRYVFLILMMLTATSLLFKFAAKETRKAAFFSYGSIFSTILFGITSFLFSIYVVRFAQYNELYGSIGTLLVLMLYIWINCFILLLGFELNALIHKLKRKNLYI